MTSGTGSAHWQLGLLQQLIELADPNNTSESEDHKVAVFEMGAKLYVTLLLGSVAQSAASVSASFVVFLILILILCLVLSFCFTKQEEFQYKPRRKISGTITLSRARARPAVTCACPPTCTERTHPLSPQNIQLSSKASADRPVRCGLSVSSSTKSARWPGARPVAGCFRAWAPPAA